MAIPANVASLLGAGAVAKLDFEPPTRDPQDPHSSGCAAGGDSFVSVDWSKFKLLSQGVEQAFAMLGRLWSDSKPAPMSAPRPDPVTGLQYTKYLPSNYGPKY
ncbi:MAG: hypothetical protein COV46_03825 [Deltaproteobacteria bacterium CG11_big_fil_rev_8_21_14_0_20_49_13]|nr:MAG: hypothetical protein COV46_03825 [Deltaproteobacteria bacterium CG11_big_fil_rev_8_21_14_0_20_49_13]